MDKENKRKFLVDSQKLDHFMFKMNYDFFRKKHIRQAYCSNKNDSIATIIRISDNRKCFLTLKSKNIESIREKFKIKKRKAFKILKLCKNIIFKIRYFIPYDGRTWKVDFFELDNDSLVIAEIEFNLNKPVIKFPEWITKEVTDENRYYNENLASNPYKNWKDKV